jgi:hypothetical protein
MWSAVMHHDDCLGVHRSFSASGHRREPAGGVVHHGARESLPTTARDQPGGPLIATTITGRDIGVPDSIRRLTVGLDRPRGQ